MPHPIVYIAFDGDCDAAMNFYAQVLDARIQTWLRGGDSPMREQIPPEQSQPVIHARLVLPDGGVLYAGDAPAHLP